MSFQIKVRRMSTLLVVLAAVAAGQAIGWVVVEQTSTAASVGGK